ncbi:MAG TPA: ABC transporter ATP-binding protein [Armatimonadota bacterium]|nr:ABC transporter ATP-binding protein [Armatimonadota bacterium]
MERLAGGLHLRIGLRQGEFSLHVELSVAPGETVVLVGPSGSGKSTCLRAIAGLARPQSGRIEIDGRAVLDTERRVDLPPWRRRVGVVFQDYALFPHLTVERNLLYGLRGVPDARRRACEWLDLLQIAELSARKPHELSGGQRQRVALARAAVTDPDVLLLDEPFGSLDAATRRTVRSELRRFLTHAARRAEGASARATLLVSHDYLDALTLGDRIAVLEDGALTQVGTREEVLRRPRTPFLAALTGHNVLRGTAAAPSASASREATVGPLVFRVPDAPEVAPGAVFLAFSPKDVALERTDAAGSPAPNRFPALIQEIVPLPDRLRVYLDAGVPLIADLAGAAASALQLSEGTRVVAAIAPEAIDAYA